MSTDLDLFANAGDGLSPEHFGVDEHGRAYVVASVFAKAMGYSSTQKATDVVDADEKGHEDIQTWSTSGVEQGRRVVVIYEDGIWELIFRSTLPSAKSIKSRVKAILRQLRETGVVDTRSAMTELEMARNYVAALERLAVAEPKAEAHDAFMDADGDYLVGTVAKMLGVGQNTLFRRLRDEKIFISNGRRRNTPYQQYAHHFHIVARIFEDGEGDPHPTYTTYVRPSGVEFIRKMLAADGAA